MSHEMEVALLDMLRGISITLYIVLLCQVGYILRHYYAVVLMERKMGHPRAGLLPSHILFLGVSLVGFAGLAVSQNILRLGLPMTYFGVFNPPLLVIATYGLHLVMQFEYRRYTYLSTDTDPPHLL